MELAREPFHLSSLQNCLVQRLPKSHSSNNQKLQFAQGNYMEITIHSGQHHSCSNSENQGSSPVIHKHIFEHQAENRPSKCVFHWFFQPTSSLGFHLKDKYEKGDTYFAPHCLPPQHSPLLPAIPNTATILDASRC